MKRLAIAAAFVTVVACEGYTGPTAPPGPTYPQVAGTYTSASFLTLRVLNAGVLVNTEVCPGSATIQQDASTLTGTIVMNVPAGDRDCVFAGTLVQGSVNPDGAVSFGLAVPGAGANFWTVSGCTFVSGSSTFTGTITGTTLTASATATLTCPGNTTITATAELSGSR
jgi:hypothetical protein